MPEHADEWYSEGLSFACRGCGRCCRGPGGYVWVSAEEVEVLARAVGMAVDSFGKRYLRRSGSRLALVDNPKGDCVFLNQEGRCDVYDVRPVQCSTFPWWPENLTSPEAWEREKRHCPGLGQGPRHRVEEIRAGIEKARKVD